MSDAEKIAKQINEQLGNPHNMDFDKPVHERQAMVEAMVEANGGILVRDIAFSFRGKQITGHLFRFGSEPGAEWLAVKDWKVCTADVRNGPEWAKTLWNNYQTATKHGPQAMQ